MTRLCDLPELAGSDAKRPFVVLSFDDGYKDFVEYVHPILDEFGLRANQNVIGYSVETGDPPQIVRFCDLLEAVPVSRLRALRLPGFDVTLTGDHPDDKDRFGAAITNYVKALGPAERGEVLADLESSWAVDADVRRTEMMSEADVLAIADAGHEVGLHSHSHESMALVDDDFFLRDLMLCRELMSRLGLETTIYSFPNGSYRSSQVEILKRSGFDRILLMEERATQPASEVHTRISVRGHSFAEIVGRSVGYGRPRSN